jgi:hypothetical protein
MTNTVYVNPFKATSTIFDIDWEECTTDSSVEEKPKEYFNFSTPPLAIVVAMLEAGKEQWEIGETVKALGKRPDIGTDSAVTKQHQETANEIYDYFAKKYTLRRLKNEHISKYMMAVEELCENRTRMDTEHIGILVTLPKFFKENRELESLMKEHQSIDLKRSQKHGIELDEIVEFVKSIRIQRKNGTATHYFWLRSNGTLIRTASKTNNIDNSAWDCLARAGKIKVKTEQGIAANIQGYDFTVLDLYHPTSISLAD